MQSARLPCSSRFRGYILFRQALSGTETDQIENVARYSRLKLHCDWICDSVTGLNSDHLCVPLSLGRILNGTYSRFECLKWTFECLWVVTKAERNHLSSNNAEVNVTG